MCDMMVYKEGYVYIYKRLNVYKIGCSTDIKRREKTLNNSKKTKYKGKMIYALLSSNYMNDEMRIQLDMKLSNISGEWFLLSDEDIKYIINRYGFEKVKK